MAKYLQAARDTLAHGGGTFFLTGTPADNPRGYYVGGRVESRIVAADHMPSLLADTIYRFVTDNVEAITPRTLIGTWRDSETGLTHIDIVDYVADAACAEELSRLRGELAYWDIAAGDEVRLLDVKSCIHCGRGFTSDNRLDSICVDCQ